MLRSGRAKLLCVLVLVGLFVALKGPGPDGFLRRSSQEESRDRTKKTEGANEPRKVEIDTSNTDERFVRFTDGTVHWMASFEKSRQLHQGELARSDLEIVERILSDYRLVYRENPVGVENFEITAALMGENPKKVFFIDPDMAIVNGEGELLDRWGSPFRFHAISGDRMNVRSLGPDRVLWSEDDLVLYKEEQSQLAE